MAAENMAVLSVTIGTDGAGVFGFTTATYGAITPASFRGNTISNARSGASNFGFLFASNAAANFFRRVVVQDTSGGFRVYQWTDASVAGGTVAWGNGTDKAWTSTSPSPRSLYIYY